MSTRTRKQITRSNQDALAAFVARKAEIDAMLKTADEMLASHQVFLREMRKLRKA